MLFKFTYFLPEFPVNETSRAQLRCETMPETIIKSTLMMIKAQPNSIEFASNIYHDVRGLGIYNS